MLNSPYHTRFAVKKFQKRWGSEFQRISNSHGNRAVIVQQETTLLISHALSPLCDRGKSAKSLRSHRVDWKHGGSARPGRRDDALWVNMRNGPVNNHSLHFPCSLAHCWPTREYSWWREIVKPSFPLSYLHGLSYQKDYNRRKSERNEETSVV